MLICKALTLYPFASARAHVDEELFRGTNTRIQKEKLIFIRNTYINAHDFINQNITRQK